jgi:hypothetical protein
MRIGKGIDLESITLNYFWFGFSLYSIAFTFPATSQVLVYLYQALQLLGIVFFVPAAYRLINWNIGNIYLKTIIIILLIYNSTILLRGIDLNYEFIKRMLIYTNDGLFMYLVPLVVLFPSKISYLRKVLILIILFGVFYIIADIIVHDILLYAVTGLRNATGIVDVLTQCLALPSGFLLLTYNYHPKKYNVMAIITLVVALYFTIVRARRGLIFVASSMIFVSYILFLFNNKDRLLKFILSVLMLALLVSSIALLYQIQRHGFFGHLDSRIGEDTRKGIEMAFYNDMTTIDWIIGKGINGQYYCPGIDEGYRVTVYRNAVETGYLQIILRGGIISLGLFLMIAVPAILKGLLDSRNMLCKSAAIWILLFLGYSYPMTISWFVLTNVLMWISIGLCFNKNIRDKTDEEILGELYS